MAKKWNIFLEDTFSLKENEGKNKILELNEAIKRYVEPGMALYLGEGANALIRELIRQFLGSYPEFTIITPFVMEQALNLVHCRLVRSIVTSS